MVDTDTSPGWDAIDTALERIYPGVEPQHFGSIIKWRLGGPDPLDGVSIYPGDRHWHLVSYGMSELYAKESDDADESGWGFEFTFRIARAAEATEPPMWAANFLQNLGRYVFSSGNVFAPGHHVDLNGPISLQNPETAIRAITFAEDPELGSIDTPNGRMRFLQIVGLTLDEYAVIERWDANRLLEALQQRNPLLVTDLGRGSLTDDPSSASAIEEGIRRDGSSTGSLFVQEASWRAEKDAAVLTFGASAAERIARVLEARLPYERGLEIHSANSAVIVRPGAQLTIEPSGSGDVEVTLPLEVVTELSSVMRPEAGVYPLRSAPGLTIEIVKSHIRDPDGNIVQEIG